MQASSAATSSGDRAAFAAMLAGNLCLACGPWLVRSTDVGPVAAGFWRLALAVPLLFLLARIRRQPLAGSAPGMLPVLVLGGLFFAADLAAWHVGILDTKLANATLFGNISSFTFPIYGYVVARQLPGRNQALALLIAAAGVGLLLGRSYEMSAANLRGDLFCVLAGLFYTAYLIMMERTRARIAQWPTLAISTLVGIVPLLLAALALGEAVWPREWAPLIGLALASQVLGQGFMLYAVVRLPPAVVGLGLLTQPVVGATIGWFAYGERLGGFDVVGAVLIAFALVLVRLEGRPTAAPAQAQTPI